MIPTTIIYQRRRYVLAASTPVRLLTVRVARRKAAGWPTVANLDGVSAADAQKFLLQWEQKLVAKGLKPQAGYQLLSAAPLTPGEARYYEGPKDSYRLILDYAYTGPGQHYATKR